MGSQSGARSCNGVACAEPAETGPFCFLQDPELFFRDHRTKLQVTQPKDVHRRKDAANYTGNPSSSPPLPHGTKEPGQARNLKAGRFSEAKGPLSRKPSAETP